VPSLLCNGFYLHPEAYIPEPDGWFNVIAVTTHDAATTPRESLQYTFEKKPPLAKALCSVELDYK
jgi:hypothetical protein